MDCLIFPNGHKMQQTSLLAYRDVANTNTEKYIGALMFFGKNGASDAEVRDIVLIDWLPGRISARRNDAMKEGRVEWVGTGEYKGRKRNVWRVK